MAVMSSTAYPCVCICRIHLHPSDTALLAQCLPQIWLQARRGHLRGVAEGVLQVWTRAGPAGRPHDRHRLPGHPQGDVPCSTVCHAKLQTHPATIRVGLPRGRARLCRGRGASPMGKPAAPRVRSLIFTLFDKHASASHTRAELGHSAPAAVLCGGDASERDSRGALPAAQLRALIRRAGRRRAPQCMPHRRQQPRAVAGRASVLCGALLLGRLPAWRQQVCHLFTTTDPR